MSDFFNVIGNVITFLNNWRIFGQISLWHIMLTCLVIGIVGKLLKSSKGG